MGFPLFVLPLPLVRGWDTLATTANCTVLVKQSYDEASAMSVPRYGWARNGRFPLGGQVSLHDGSVNIMICSNIDSYNPEEQMFTAPGADWLGMFHWDGHHRSSNRLAAMLAAMFIASGAECHGRGPVKELLTGNTAIFRSTLTTMEQFVENVLATFRNHGVPNPPAHRQNAGPFFNWFSVIEQADVGVSGYWGPSLNLASGESGAFLAIRKMAGNAKSSSVFEQCITWLRNQRLEEVLPL
jgi:hypothetical protein